MHGETEITLEVRTEEDLSNLYEFYIAEVDADGNEVETFIYDKWIPFSHSIKFETKTIRYVPSFGYESEFLDLEDAEENEKEKTKKKTREERFDVQFKDEESLVGDLILTPDDNPSNVSFFGANRTITNFSLRIIVGKKDLCRMWGHPQTTVENAYFQDEEIPDMLGLDIVVKEKKFRELANLVLQKSLSSLSIRVGLADGVYAPWSPSWTADALKFLTPHQELKDPKGQAPHFRSLGVVREMSISPVVSQDLSVSKGIADENEEGEGRQVKRASNDSKDREVKGYSKPESDDITWKFVGFGVVILLLLIFSNS